jgi:hypothetical protein
VRRFLVRRFLVRTLPLLDLAIEGDPDGFFGLWSGLSDDSRSTSGHDFWSLRSIDSRSMSRHDFCGRMTGKKKGKPGRKPKEAGAVIQPTPQRARHEAVSFKDMRTMRAISNRLGPTRMRELVALMAD